MSTAAYTNLKPLQNYSEHDVINLFAFTGANLDKGAVVKVNGEGFINGQQLEVASNESPTTRAYSPRWAVKAKVGLAGSGDYPLGITLRDVKEENQFGYPLRFDPTRKAEAQAVVSGEAVPVLRKGEVLYNVGTGVTSVGSGAAVGATEGALTITTPDASNKIGTFLGNPDDDGYALLSINCY